MIVWFASGNAHKQAELAAILNRGDGGAAARYTVKIPADGGLAFDPDETGTDFHENALIKARALYRLLLDLRPASYSPGDPVIADDSGLCVDALDGRPGIYSARYGSTGRYGSIGQFCGTASGVAANGKTLEAAERNALLLEELGDNPRRSARFVCAMVLFFCPDRFYLVQETLEGEIVKSPEQAGGTGGFGYDPILYISALGRTVAELSVAEKNRMSHRGKAGTIIAGILRKTALE